MVNVGGATGAPGAQWWYPSAMDNAMQSMQNASAVCTDERVSQSVDIELAYSVLSAAEQGGAFVPFVLRG